MSSVSELHGHRLMDLRKWLLTLAPPLLIAGGIQLWAFSDRTGGVGPLDRATTGWLVILPMVLIGVGLSALLPQTLGKLLGFAGLTFEAFVVAAATALLLITTTDFLGCTRVTGLDQVLLPSAVVGLVLGACVAAAGFVGSTLVSSKPGGTVLGVAVAIAVAGIGALGVLMIWTLLFPITLCGPSPV